MSHASRVTVIGVNGGRFTRRAVARDTRPYRFIANIGPRTMRYEYRVDEVGDGVDAVVATDDRTAATIRHPIGRTDKNSGIAKGVEQSAFTIEEPPFEDGRIRAGEPILESPIGTGMRFDGVYHEEVVKIENEPYRGMAAMNSRELLEGTDVGIEPLDMENLRFQFVNEPVKPEKRDDIDRDGFPIRREFPDAAREFGEQEIEPSTPAEG